MKFKKIFLPDAGFKGCIAESVNSSDTVKWLEDTFASRAEGAEFIVSNEDRKVLSLEAPDCLSGGRNKSKLCFKVYIHGAEKFKVSDLYKVFRASIVWKLFIRLFTMKIPVPEPLGFLSARVDGQVYQVLMYRYLYGKTLADFAQNNLPLCGFAERRKLISAVARFVAMLHDAGVYHGDFHANNILVRQKGNDYKCFLIDVDAVRSIYFISRRRRIKNLDELGRNFLNLAALSTSDRMFFIREYTRVCSVEQKSHKQLFANVLSRTSQRMSKHKLVWENKVQIPMMKVVMTGLYLWICDAFSGWPGLTVSEGLV